MDDKYFDIGDTFINYNNIKIRVYDTETNEVYKAYNGFTDYYTGESINLLLMKCIQKELVDILKSN